MAQTKKKTATRTAKKTACRRATGARANTCTARKQKQQGSNMFFVISMTVLAATLLFADMLMMLA